jgi:hypothetical protein
MASFNFSANEYDDFEGGGNFDPVPEGEYEMMGEDAEEKSTSSGGTMIKAKFRILGPEFKNRVVFNNFNIVNKSETAQEIGRRQLSTWARAVGKPNASDTDELLNRPFIGLVGVEAASGNYGPQNRLNGFKAKEENVMRAASTPAPKAAPSPVSFAAPSAPVAPATPPAVAPPAAASPSKPGSTGKKAPWDD